MTFFLPLWLCITLGTVLGTVYFTIGFLHAAFDLGTSGRNIGPESVRLFFFWPYDWLKLIVTALGIIFLFGSYGRRNK